MIGRGWLAALAAAACLGAGACGQGPTVCVDVGCEGWDVLSLAISPSSFSIPAGSQAHAWALLTGVPRDAPTTVCWATTDTTVAAVVQAYDTAGLHAVIVAGRAAGRTTLVVTADADVGVKAAAIVDVVAGTPSAARGPGRGFWQGRKETSMKQGSVWAVLVLALSSALAACGGDGLTCTAIAKFGIVVTVRDSITGSVVPGPVVVTGRDGSYVETAGPPFSNGVDSFVMAVERKGRYDVTVQAPDYRPWVRTGVAVTADQCHVHTVQLQARLQKQ